MVFRKRSMRRRARRSKNTKARVATKAYVKKQIHKDEETKYFDKVQSAITAIDYSGTNISLLSGVTQGVGDSQRVGDKITLRALRLRLAVAYNGLDATIRVILFQYKQQTALHPAAVSELLTPGYVGTINAAEAPFTHDYQGFYKPFYDKTVCITSVGPKLKYFDIKPSLKFLRKTIAYSAGTTDAYGHIYCLVISNVTGVNAPQSTLVSRIWYDDA